MTDTTKLLPTPYCEMLNRMASAQGYSDFKRFVEERYIITPDSIKAEIKAIFEFYHQGMLRRIYSAGESTPEAEIELEANGQKYKGIIEVAFVNYRADTITDTRVLINNALNVKKGTKVDATFPEKQLRVIKDGNVTLIAGGSADLSVKIPRLYERKRKQHSKRYQDYNKSDKSGYIKVYYFLVDAPPTQIAQFFANHRILNKLKPGEILVLTSIHDGCKHSQVTIFGGGIELKFELDNPYFSFD